MKITLSANELRSFLASHPSLEDVPISILNGKPISISDVLRLGKVTFEFPSDDEIWELALEYCSRILTKYPEKKLFLMTREGAVELSVIDRIEHLRKRTEIGKILHKMYKTFLTEIFRWMSLAVRR